MAPAVRRCGNGRAGGCRRTRAEASGCTAAPAPGCTRTEQSAQSGRRRARSVFDSFPFLDPFAVVHAFSGDGRAQFESDSGRTFRRCIGRSAAFDVAVRGTAASFGAWRRIRDGEPRRGRIAVRTVAEQLSAADEHSSAARRSATRNGSFDAGRFGAGAPCLPAAAARSDPGEHRAGAGSRLIATAATAESATVEPDPVGCAQAVRLVHRVLARSEREKCG